MNLRKSIEVQGIERGSQEQEELNRARQLDAISQDFRTSLSVILLATGFISRNKDHAGGDVVNEKLKQIEKQVVRMSLLLDELVPAKRTEQNQGCGKG